MSTLRVPSTTLLRTFLIPGNITLCVTQLRQASNYMPRSKFANITRLDKLHRTQKSVLRQQKFAAIQRADAISATFSPASYTNETIPFTIARTPGSQLPVYESAKNGGNRHVTTIRKLSGDIDSLAAELLLVLKLPEFILDRKGNKKASIAVNRLTNQLVIRGWRGQEVKAWMEGIGF